MHCDSEEVSESGQVYFSLQLHIVYRSIDKSRKIIEEFAVENICLIILILKLKIPLL